jgi:hypothetical protein
MLQIGLHEGGRNAIDMGITGVRLRRMALGRLQLDADAGFTLSHFFVLAVAHQALVTSNQQGLNGFGF